MSTNSIAITNLNSGEVFDTDLKLSDNKYAIRGHKMYNNGVLELVDVLTRAEMKQTIELFDAKFIDYYNIFTLPFSKLTPSMSKAARSRFKHKLLDNGIMAEYNKKLMLNPYTFIPRGDKNLRNCNHLTQRVWKYLFEDYTTMSDDVVDHAEHMFGELQGITSKYLRVGSGEHSKLVTKPN